MPQIINTNISSLNAQRALNRSQESLATSLQRLSSGLRINSARDDAAGLAISDRFTTQIRGTNQAVRNANDGISVAQVAEGALQESTNILQRIRELAVQSANDSNGASDRDNLQKEVNQALQELERIATSTSFNGRNLLDGSFSGTQFHIGAFAFETVQVDIGNVRNQAIGTLRLTNDEGASSINDATTGTANNVAAQTLTISGSFGSENISVAAGSSAATIAESINRASEATGVSANAVSYALLDGFGATGTYTFTLTGSGTETVSVNLTNTANLSEVADAVNSVSGSTGISATLSPDGADITLFSSTGDDIEVSKASGIGNAGDITLQGVTEDGVTTVSAAETIGSGSATDASSVGGNLIFDSSSFFSVATSATGTLFTQATSTSTLNAVDTVDISTQIGANNALAIVDGALAQVSEVRANLGAIQNRLTATVSNLENVSENVSAARSRVLDADFAAETANLTRASILQQAGISVLAQSNALPQQVLALLQ